MPELLYDLLVKPQIAIPHIIGRGILPVKGKMVLAGSPKSNKSWLAMNMAIGMARGRTPFDAKFNKGTDVFPVYESSTVLYFEQEMGETGLKDRFAAGLLTEERSVGLPFYFQTRDVRYQLDTEEGQRLITEAIQSCNPKVLVFDPLAKFHSANEDSSQEMGRVLRYGDYLIETFGVSIIYIHHTSKPAVDPKYARKGGDRLRGSSAIFADVDTVALVDQTSADGTLEPNIKVAFELRRGEPLPVQTFQRLKTGQVIHLGQGTNG